MDIEARAPSEDAQATLDALSRALRDLGVGAYRATGDGGPGRWLAGARAAASATALPGQAGAVRLLATTGRPAAPWLAPPPCPPALSRTPPAQTLPAQTLPAQTLPAPPTERAALFAVAIDDFAAFARCYGHEAGVALAAAVSDRLRRAAPEAQGLTALGGAVFALSMRDCDDPLNAARWLAAEIAASVFDAGFGPVRVTVSVGVCHGAADPPAQSGALDVALAALDDAVAQGAPQHRALEHAGAGPVGTARSPATMRADAGAVMRALQADAIGVAYQPVALAHQPARVAFRECLARLRDPQGGWVAAGRFVPAVERLDLIAALDTRVLREALRMLRAHPTERLSVNVSARTVRDGRWLGALREGAQEDRRSVERLIVELTESAAVADVDHTQRFLDAARDLGCAIALDDFGAGYSSFRHLRAFRPDWVKIDGSFVRGLADDPDNMLFVDALVGIASSFDMATVAEFVETEAEAAALRMLGVDCLQGWLVGKPEMTPTWTSPLAGVDKG